MIITQESVTVETNIKKSNRATFGVKADGKLFAILTKNLYANPVLGTLQELGQNCFDAHARANKPEVPFEVTLPTLMNPNLIVRDFGQSMTDHFMMNEYCTAFESTKDTDPNQAGGYGIGKLICLALSTTYTIACYQGGKRRGYSVFMNGDGLPEIIHTSTKDTTERDGVEVIVPVQEKDISSFYESARAAYKYYNPRPVVKGMRHFEFEAINKTISGKNWYLDANSSSPRAVGGIYSYPIESQHIHNLKSEHQTFIDSGLGFTLLFGPSEITPQTNRQGLNYDEKTINAIKNRLLEIESEIRAAIQSEFDKCANIIEAKRLYYKHFAYSGASYQVGRLLGSTPTVKWKTYDIDDEFLYTGKPNPSNKNSFIPLAGVKIKKYSLSWARHGHKVKEFDDELRISTREGHRIYINDMDGGRGCKYRVGYMLKNSGNSNNEFYALSFDTPQAEADFHALNGTDATIFTGKVSDIVVPRGVDVDMAADNVKHKLKVFKFNHKCHGHSGTSSDFWEPTEIDIDEGGVYVTIYRFDPQIGGSNSTIKDRYNLLLKHKVITEDVVIYGIKTSQVQNPPILAEVQASKDWISFDKWIEDKRATLLPSVQVQQTIIDSLQYNDVSKYSSLVKYKKNFNNPTVINFLDAVAFIAKQFGGSSKARENIADFISLGGSYTDIVLPPTFDVPAILAKLKAEYPLFNHFGYFTDKEEINLFTQYVEMVDTARSVKAQIVAPKVNLPVAQVPEEIAA